MMDENETETSTAGKMDFDQQFEEARREQGPYEVDISFTAEGDFPENWKKCKKDPEHKNFIPIDKFTLENLPDRYRVLELFDLIKHLAHLTVKITINYSSSARPQLHPNGGMYPTYRHKGTDISRFGSGRVWDIRKIDGQPCPCRACRGSATPLTSWGEVNIVTATHVVFDDDEGKNTICHLGFNNANIIDVILEGTGVGRAEIESDLCYVRCVTHNVGLLDKLEIHLDKFKDRCEELFESFSNDKPKLIVIVSHPHGYYKQVSVGEWEDCLQTSSGNSKYTYTTCTCPGSSGAPVYILGKEKGWWCSHHHSGAVNGKNISGIGWL